VGVRIHDAIMFSIYYSSRDIYSLSAILLLKVFPDLKNNMKSSNSPLHKCFIIYNTLKRSSASRILTTTSERLILFDNTNGCSLLWSLVSRGQLLASFTELGLPIFGKQDFSNFVPLF
jgi:hypothetical protein